MHAKSLPFIFFCGELKQVQRCFFSLTLFFNTTLRKCFSDKSESI